MSQILEKVADAIDAARYAHPEHPRERPMPFAQAHPTDREYALRLARAALRASDVEGLTKERDELFLTNGEIANTIGADALRLRSALVHVREIIKEAALTGFNCHDGDWAERLFASQAVTHAALQALHQQTVEPSK